MVTTSLYLAAKLFDRFDPDPERYQQAIDEFIASDTRNPLTDKPVIFVGSSSIRLWKLAEYYPSLPGLNRGFGGSQLSDVNHYIEPLILKHSPSIVVLYAGENDVAQGKPAEAVLEDFKIFTEQILQALPKTQIVFISIKPSPHRWQIWSQMQKTNQTIQAFINTRDNLHYVDISAFMIDETGPIPTLYRKDGLHMKKSGYDIWTRELNKLLIPLYSSIKASAEN